MGFMPGGLAHLRPKVHLGAMETSVPVVVAVGRNGGLIYTVDMVPEALPPVSNRDLSSAWVAARDAADASAWGVPRGFRFRRATRSLGEDDADDRPSDTLSDVILADADAACWADAVDRRFGLATSYGLSLCLRLLALVELLSRTRRLVRFCSFQPDGAELHPALLSLAARAPLKADLRFDESHFHAALDTLSGVAGYLTGASG